MKSTNAVRTEIHYAQIGSISCHCSPCRRPMIPNRWANMAGCGWPTSNPAPCAVSPDAAERYALAAFAGCPKRPARGWNAR